MAASFVFGRNLSFGCFTGTLTLLAMELCRWAIWKLWFTSLRSVDRNGMRAKEILREERSVICTHRAPVIRKKCNSTLVRERVCLSR